MTLELIRYAPTVTSPEKAASRGAQCGTDHQKGLFCRALAAISESRATDFAERLGGRIFKKFTRKFYERWDRVSSSAPRYVLGSDD
jgi:hypothetical protein